MSRRFGCRGLCVAVPAIVLAAFVVQSPGARGAPAQYTDWPRVVSELPSDAAVEARVAEILATMTLAQKVGQMTQPETPSISPSDVRRYYIGSVLSGGGAYPNGNRTAPATAWLEGADAYWEASMSTDMRVKIPVMWGIDAVHGHGKAYGATVFPHNIGLGATRDADLVRRIGIATATQMRVTGHDWTFSPCVAVVRDDRWGRTYEGYSEDPLLVRELSAQAVTGLQQRSQQDSSMRKMTGVIATAKHYLGDGGTAFGIDQGQNMATEAEMMNIHAQGYYGAIASGVQTIMASFNSWNQQAAGARQGKMHGNQYLLDEVLKSKIGFDGIVVSDWNGIGQVDGCSNTKCAKAINAGIDVFMVPGEWKRFISDTIALVEKGEVKMARIDDAVTRILRVKLRAGIFDLPKPSRRDSAGNVQQLVHRDLAREAVRKSLVLLKNNNAVLPLQRAQKVLVVGKSANSIVNQTGGWTLTWQGTENRNADFPSGNTVLAGIRSVVGEGNVTYSEEAANIKLSGFGVVIAVIGETPYAEMKGDIGPNRTLDHSLSHREDVDVLERVRGHGIPVVTVFISGRPLYTNFEINRSDAFVAAWLPGTEGAAVAEVLFRRADGEVNFDFVGKLPSSWPRDPCQSPVNLGDATYQPLFPYGFGLHYSKPGSMSKLAESSPDRCN